MLSGAYISGNSQSEVPYKCLIGYGAMDLVFISFIDFINVLTLL
jgi:hypothetical protein